MPSPSEASKGGIISSAYEAVVDSPSPAGQSQTRCRALGVETDIASSSGGLRKWGMAQQRRPAGEMRSTFLAEAEHHLRTLDSDELRLVMRLHLLFAEELVLTDSQVLNNQAFRTLVSADSADHSLEPLFESGALKVALRDGRGLAEIAAEQRQRQVVGTPAPRYAARLESMSASSTLSWDVGKAATSFKEHVLWTLSDLESKSGIDLALRDSVVSWISEQEVLYFTDLRTHLNGIDGGDSAAVIDRLVAYEYGRTVPRLCGLYVAEGSDLQSPTDYFGVGEDQLELAGRSNAKAIWGLRPSVLSGLPISVFLEARNLKATRELSDLVQARQVATAPAVIPLGDVTAQLARASLDRDRPSDAQGVDRAGAAERAKARKIDDRIAELVWEIVETLDDVARVHSYRSDYSLEQLSVSMRLRVSPAELGGNSLTLMELVQNTLTAGIGTVLGVGPLLSLVFAGSGIYGSSVQDKQARQDRARNELRNLAARSGIERRAYFPVNSESVVSRRLVPPLG